MKQAPPLDRHKDFFRDVVALARQHGMDHLNLRFGDAFSMNKLEGGNLSFEGRWTSGRHGSDGIMNLQWHASANLQEKAPDDERKG